MAMVILMMGLIPEFGQSFIVRSAPERRWNRYNNSQITSAWKLYESKRTGNIDPVTDKKEEKGGPAIFGYKLTDPQDVITIFLSGVIAVNLIDLIYIYGKRLLHL